MNQTTLIFWALFVGFVVYVTAKGNLPKYFALLWVRGSSGSAVSPPTSQQPIQGIPGVQAPQGIPWQALPGSPI